MTKKAQSGAISVVSLLATAHAQLTAIYVLLYLGVCCKKHKQIWAKWLGE
jgi:hypothetical protein